MTKIFSKITLKIISWAAVALWMLLIFRLSSQVADTSNGLSLGVTEQINRILANLTQIKVDTLNHIVRKSAHFTAYLILALLCLNAVRVSGVLGRKRYLTVIWICILYSISDEIHQLFVPGRSGSPKDVIIDTSGAVVGIIISIILRKLLFRKGRSYL